MYLKKSAVPEYIWYISLIIIAITLVVGVANIAKKANKNIEPPSNLNVQFDVIIDPNNIVKIKTLEFIGDFDLEKDAPNLYLKCGNSYKNLMELFLAKNPNELFTRKATGSIGLKDFDGLKLVNIAKGDQVFDFYDDFNDDSYTDKWKLTNTNEHPYQSNGYLYTTGTSGYDVGTIKSFNPGIIIETVSEPLNNIHYAAVMIALSDDYNYVNEKGFTIFL
jgi:hypothetical protein